MPQNAPLPARLADPVTAYKSVLAVIYAGESVGPADVAEISAPYVPIEGTCRVFLPPAHHNIVIFDGASDEVAAILDTLLTDPELEAIGAAHVTRVGMMADGITPPLPLALRPPKHGYKHPHWLPVLIRRVRGDTPGSPAGDHVTDCRTPKGHPRGYTKDPGEGRTRTHAHAIRESKANLLERGEA